MRLQIRGFDIDPVLAHNDRYARLKSQIVISNAAGLTPTEADWPTLRWRRLLKKSNRIEHNPEATIEPLLELVDPSRKVDVFTVEPPDSHEHPHDSYVDCDCARSPQNRGEHRDALLA